MLHFLLLILGICIALPADYLDHGVFFSMFAINLDCLLTYGIVLFHMFDALDVRGLVEGLPFVSGAYRTDIAFIAESAEPVSTRPQSAMKNTLNSSVYPSLPQTHTFEIAPDLEVSMIPGGPRWRNPSSNAMLEYIRKTVPTAQHIKTICTGSALATPVGIPNGREATANNFSWISTIAAKR